MESLEEMHEEQKRLIRESRWYKPPRRLRREATLEDLSVPTAAVVEKLSNEGFAVGVSAKDLQELCLFIAYGLQNEADLASYVGAASDSQHERDAVIRRIRSAICAIWKNVENQLKIFPSLSANAQEPLKPTITYGLYNVVAREAEVEPEKFGLKRTPRLFPLMVGTRRIH